MTEQAARDNEGKPKLAQIWYFGHGLKMLAAVMDRGRDKYPDQPNGIPNWYLGNRDDELYLDCASRHFESFMDAKAHNDLAMEYDEDENSDVMTHHLAHTIWNLLALLSLNRADCPVTLPRGYLLAREDLLAESPFRWDEELGVWGHKDEKSQEKS